MKTADVVIIGAGIMGLSTAYHLARRGCRNVLVLEKEGLPGLGSTGKNAGGIRHQFSTKVNVELSRLSFQMFDCFEEEFEQSIELNHCGYLFLIDNENSLQYFHQCADLQRNLGVETEILSLSEIEDLIPEFHLERIIGGSFNRQDGLVDPSGVLNGYAGRSQRMGVKLCFDTPVNDLVLEGDRICGVETSSGLIRTPTILVAAGPWSGQIGRSSGIRLPIEPLRRQLAITRTAEKIRRNLPFVVDFSDSLYFHYEGGGILTGMSNPGEKPGFSQEVDEEWREIHLEKAIRRLPLLAEAELVNEWAGLYEMTPDCQPILGAVERVSGLFVCAGFSGHGFMHGPACGLLMAEEILEGKASTINIDELRLSRFESPGSVGEFNVI